MNNRTSGEIKRISRDILNDRYNVPMGAFMIAGLIPAVIRFPFSSDDGYQTVPQFFIALVANFLIMLIAQVLRTGVIRIHLNMTRAGGFRLSQVFDPLRRGTERYFCAAFFTGILLWVCGIPFFAGSLYFYLAEITAFSVAVLVITGTLSLVSAVFFVLSYSFVPHFLLDYPQMRVTAAFRECRKLMRGNRRRLFGLLCSFIGYGVPVVLSFGFALLWVGPYMTQTMVTFYLDCTCELDRIPVRSYGAGN